MEAIVEVMDAERLASIMSIPETMRYGYVRVIVTPEVRGYEMARPINDDTDDTQEEMRRRIEAFRIKYHHDDFIEHLKKSVAEGFVFDFDVQKIIDGDGTPEERAEILGTGEQYWAKGAVKRFERVVTANEETN